MRLLIFFAACLSITGRAYAQVTYMGMIGSFPIEMATKFYSDNNVHAVYAYTKFHDPIVMNGKTENGKMVFYETDKKEHKTASLTFSVFSKKAATLSGTWRNMVSGKELPVTLHKEFDIEDLSPGKRLDREILQGSAMKQNYFRIVAGLRNGDSAMYVKGVKILDKKTDKLIQLVTPDGEFDCELSGGGLHSVEVGDYNFDGFEDFSIFETSYAGPNTSSLYYLYDPNAKQFFKSSFEGVSLEFDKKTKTISELNQCCAGRQQTLKKYKVVNNKMVLTEQHCLILDEHKDRYIEHKMKDCE